MNISFHYHSDCSEKFKILLDTDDGDYTLDFSNGEYNRVHFEGMSNYDMEEIVKIMQSALDYGKPKTIKGKGKK